MMEYSEHTDAATGFLSEIRELCDRLEVKLAELKEIEEDYFICRLEGVIE